MGDTLSKGLSTSDGRCSFVSFYQLDSMQFSLLHLNYWDDVGDVAAADRREIRCSSRRKAAEVKLALLKKKKGNRKIDSA